MSAELNYCNRCGAVNPVALMTAQASENVSITKPTIVLGLVTLAITLGGMALLIAGAVELGHRPSMGNDPIMALLFFGMACILIIDMMLIRLFSRIINHALESPAKSLKPARGKNSKAVKGQPLAERQLGPRPDYVPSITENTTRTLEHSVKERGT